MTDPVPTPLTEQVRVTAVEPAPGDGVRISALVTVDPDNPILAGHYPGLPIFPGVCLIECAHRTVLAAVRPGSPVPDLAAVLTARFLDTAFPGDEIRIRTEVTKGAGQWLAAAELRGDRGLVAKLSLRYRLPGGGR
jgi:3-hydroxyacyl-[acyl-carrier-protein] dehydratase